MAAVPKSILKTPTRKIRNEDFIVQAEDNEETAYTEADSGSPLQGTDVCI